MHAGKQIRLKRLMNATSGKTVIVPMDHGVSVGAISGLVNFPTTINEIVSGGANAILCHKGIFQRGAIDTPRDVGRILHLSSSTDLSDSPNKKVLTATVEDAIRLGADAVSMHVNLGNEHEPAMLKDLGKVASACDAWGMPLLVMVYARGKHVHQFDPATIAHCARVVVELGADIVKVPYTGDMESFSLVVESACVPVVIAGGEKMKTIRDFVQIVHDSVKAGGAGLSVGRNIFQHAAPQRLVQVLGDVVHNNCSVTEAMAKLEA